LAAFGGMSFFALFSNESDIVFVLFLKKRIPSGITLVAKPHPALMLLSSSALSSR
jgi:hypothetical protein